MDTASAPTASDEQEAHVQLGSELGIEEAGSLHQRLCAAVDEPRPVVLEAHDVSNVHTAALELFCLFCRDRREAGRETRWDKPSETLIRAAQLLGVTTLLALARDAQAAQT